MIQSISQQKLYKKPYLLKTGINKLNKIKNYPVNSPDLNTIENIFEIGDRNAHSHFQKNFTDLDYWTKYE